MTEEELNRLEAMAKAATSGPWARHHDPEVYAVYQPEFECWIPQDGNDADFIAAANPTTILSLIRLARVGLGVEKAKLLREQAIIALDEYYEAGGTRLADFVAALPKPGVRIGPMFDKQEYLSEEADQIFDDKPGGE